MGERMLDKSAVPTEPQIVAHMGEDAWGRLQAFEAALDGVYDLQRELRFPFGNSYGWGYKYQHKSAHLCYAFFERGGFTVTVQIGDAQVPLLEAALPELSPKARRAWDDRYPCGKQGGWVHYAVTCDADVKDAAELVQVRKKPVRGK